MRDILVYEMASREMAQISPCAASYEGRSFIHCAKGGRAPKKSCDFAKSPWQLFPVYILGA